MGIMYNSLRQSNLTPTVGAISDFFSFLSTILGYILEIGSFILLIVVMYESYEKIDSLSEQVDQLRDMVMLIDPDISLAFDSNSIDIARSKTEKMLNSIPASADPY